MLVQVKQVSGSNFNEVKHFTQFFMVARARWPTLRMRGALVCPALASSATNQTAEDVTASCTVIGWTAHRHCVGNSRRFNAQWIKLQNSAALRTARTIPSVVIAHPRVLHTAENFGTSVSFLSQMGNDLSFERKVEILLWTHRKSKVNSSVHWPSIPNTDKHTCRVVSFLGAFNFVLFHWRSFEVGV